MARSKEIKTQGRLVLKEIDFRKVYYCQVGDGGNSARVYLPKKLIGKNVYVIVDEHG